MGRRKKDAHPFNIKMDSRVYERLETYCDEKGQTMTTAVERLLTAAFDENDKAKDKNPQ